MDSSSSKSVSPVDFLLGKPFSYKNFTHEDWFRLIDSIFAQIKPRLKYLPQMMELRHYMNRSERRFKLKSSEEKLHEVVGYIRPKDRCVSVCGIPCRSTCLTHPTQCARTLGLHDHEIIVTQAGDFFTLVCEYDRRRDSEYRLRDIEVKPIAISDLPLVEATDQIIILSNDRRKGSLPLGAILYDGLFKLVQDAVVVRRKRLDELEEIRLEMERTIGGTDILQF